MQYVLPYTFKTGHLAVGAVGNFGINKRKHGTCEEISEHCALDDKDNVHFYLSYDIQGDGLLGFFSRPKPTGTGSK